MKEEEIVDILAGFLREFYYDQLISAATEGKKSIVIDFSVLDKHDTDLADYLLENPDEVFKASDDAIRQIDLPGEPKLKMRVVHLPEGKEIRIRNVRSEHIGKLISIDGIVKRSSEIRPEVSETVFECPDCGERITLIQTERTMKAPFRCTNPSCRNMKGFKLIEQKLYDARWIAVEEPYETTSGERPSTLTIYLKEDLTTPKMQSKTDPGNRIKVVGMLRELPKRIKGTRSRQMEIYLEANSIENLEVEWEEIEIASEDEKKILEMAHDPEIYEKLVKSIGPAIYGLDDVKEAIALQLFGGETHIQKDKSRVRGDIHILLVGDPSTAKSALMKVVTTLIPRAKYVSGKGVTGAGLTASVIKDEEFLGGWVLEAGALVMTNRSLLAIDEFEKVEKSDQIALHEAMEQQTISIAKANIVATLPAMTAILGGGNPKLGRFDPYLPIKEQLDLPETILSRFDLKFALRDIPNVEIDTKIAEHILKARHFEEDEMKPVIDSDLFKKYVSYVRKNCHPKLTREAGLAISDFFLKLREKVASEEAPVPISWRQYEAMIRLAEAAAKVQLRDTVTAEDALRAINLMKASLRMFGFEPETGKIDIDRVEGYTTSAQRSKIRVVLDAIEELGKTFGKNIPIDEVVRKAKSQGVDNADEIVKKMLNEGMLFSPQPHVIQKI